MSVTNDRPSAAQLLHEFNQTLGVNFDAPRDLMTAAQHQRPATAREHVAHHLREFRLRAFKIAVVAHDIACIGERRHGRFRGQSRQRSTQLLRRVSRANTPLITPHTFIRTKADDHGRIVSCKRCGA